MNLKDDDNLTPLHYTAINNFKEVAEVLCKYGADLNSKNNDNWTPLHWSAI